MNNTSTLTYPAFQSTDYLKALSGLSGFKSLISYSKSRPDTFFLGTRIQEGNGIKAFFSKRIIVYADFSSFHNNEDAMELIKTFVNEQARKAIYIEIRNLSSPSVFIPDLNKLGFSYHPHLNAFIPIENKSVEEVMNVFTYNRKRECKLSLKEGTLYEEASNEIDVKALYSILANLYKNKVKLPLPSYDYFLAIYKSNIGKVFIVKHGDKVIGGSFCLFDQQTIYTLYYCGISDYHKKIFPTHLAVLAVIEWGIHQNIKKVDLMGAGKPHEHYGVREYKKQFGAEVVEYGRFVYISNPILYKIGKIGVSLLKKLK